MIHHFSTFDAYTSLFLRRPWLYLHAVWALEPPKLLNTSISLKIYSHGPIPYPDLAFSAGFNPKTGRLELMANPAPRAFVVYASRVIEDPAQILSELAQGHDIHKCALLERPLREPLPVQAAAEGAEVLIRRFEPNAISLDVTARENGLLVLAEAWYPGWKAEIDGKVMPMLPANYWMRAVPVTAGRHQVRVFFHQNYLIAGGIISLVSAVLLGRAWRGGV
jgi:hypothetical protein